MAKGSGGGGGVPQDRNIYGTVGDDVLGTRDRGITFGLAGNDTITGGLEFDVVMGGDGKDTIRVGANSDNVWGGLGDDFIDGGADIDTVNYQNVDYGVVGAGLGAASGVTVNLNIKTAQNTVGAGIDTIVGFENIGGSNFNDLLIGLANQSSTIVGWSGNDRIIGGNVADRLYGDAGSDIINGGGGDDQVEGQSGNDTLRGGAGDDYLRPDGPDNFGNFIGNDFVDGGLGVDGISYYFDTTTGVTVNLSLLTAQNTVGGGIDTIINVENVQGTTFNDSITGNNANNYLWGGGGGIDTLFGLGGNDQLEAAFGSADGGDGNDLVIAGTKALGGNGDDDVRGGIANGGAGNDRVSGNTMTGGLGIDIFNPYETTNDSITDFSRVQGDKIDLHNFPLNFGIVTPLTFVGYAPFTSFLGHPEIRIVAGVGEQIVEIDLAGDRVPDQIIHVAGTTPLVASDFILV